MYKGRIRKKKTFCNPEDHAESESGESGSCDIGDLPQELAAL